jgi:hypothetical protein
VEAAFGVLTDEKGRIGITHAGFAMAALPHKKTPETLWKKDAGAVRLLVESGHDADGVPIGIPYGSIARMILLYLQTQAVRTRCREVELGASMNAWLGAMGIPAGGKTYQIVREQSRRISRCRLTFFRRTETAEMVTNGAFVRDAILPLDSTAAQLHLWQERVRLDEGFYQSLIDHPLPLREEAVRQISSRSMAIDFYVWLAYRQGYARAGARGLPGGPRPYRRRGRAHSLPLSPAGAGAQDPPGLSGLDSTAAPLPAARDDVLGQRAYPYALRNL